MENLFDMHVAVLERNMIIKNNFKPKYILVQYMKFRILLIYFMEKA